MILGASALIPAAGRNPDIGNVDTGLLGTYERIQKRFGRDLPINSGYRSPQRNFAAGGAKRSQHMEGNALDIDVRDLSKQDRLRLIQIASEEGITGVGVYDNALHFDIGPRRAWGPTYKRESIPEWAKPTVGQHLYGKFKAPQTQMAGGGGADTLMGQDSPTYDPAARAAARQARQGTTAQAAPQAGGYDPQARAQARRSRQGEQPAAERPSGPPQMPEGMVQMPNGYVLDTNAIVEDSFRNRGLAPYITGLAGNFLQGIPFVGEYIDEIIGARGDIAGEVPGLRQELARAYQRKFAELYPDTAMAAQITGGVVSTVPAAIMAAPAVAAAAPASLPMQVVTGAGAGAALGGAEGAVSGFGAGTGGVDDRLDAAGDRAAMGAAVGGALGAAVPVVSKAVGAVAENLNTRNTKAVAKSQGVSEPAAEITGRMVQNDGGTAAMRRLDAPDSMLADAGPASAGLLDAMTQKAGPGGALAQKAVGERAVAAAQDMDTALNRAFGPASFYNPVRDPKQARITKRLYDRAYAVPIDYSSGGGRRLESLLERVPASAFRQADELMKAQGLQSRQRLIQIQPDGSVLVSRYPDVMQLDYITRALNDVAEEANSKGKLGGTTNRGRVYANLSREIRNELKAEVPAWKQAVDNAADEISLKKARELGEVAMRDGTTRGDLFEALDGMGKAELNKLKEGVRANIDDILANVKRVASDGDVEAREGLKALKDLSSRSAHQKLEMILGKREADVLIKRMDRAWKAFELKARVATNSKTMARQSFDEAVKNILEPSALGRLLEGSPVKAGQRLVQAMTNMTPAARQEVQEKLAGDIVRLLTEKRGRNAQRVLDALVRGLEKDKAGMELAQALRLQSGALTFSAGDQAQVPLQMNRPQ